MEWIPGETPVGERECNDQRSAASATPRTAWRWHGHWMAWNTGLAAVPLVLSFALFSDRRRRSPAWWFGFVVFVAFLPDAPYVLTDVVHLFGHIRRSGTSDGKLLLVVVPVFTLFFAIGMGCYAVSLRRRRGWRRPGRC